MDINIFYFFIPASIFRSPKNPRQISYLHHLWLISQRYEALKKMMQILMFFSRIMKIDVGESWSGLLEALASVRFLRSPHTYLL